MSFDKLEPVWPIIIDMLDPGVPKALSGCPKPTMDMRGDYDLELGPDELAPAGQARRAEIRRNDLAMLMRVSSSFNNLASKTLYRIVITDDFLGFIAGVRRSRAHRDVESKAELLRRVQHLHVEYGKKGHEPTYLDYMVDKRYWEAVRQNHVYHTAIVQAKLEAERFAKNMDFQRIAEIATFSYVCGLDEKSATGMLPANEDSKLSHISIGAIFGGQDAIWSAAIYEPEPGEEMFTILDTEEYVALCQHRTLAAFRHSPSLAQFCQRSTAGPFAWPLVADWTGPTPSPNSTSTKPLFTLHVSNCSAQWAVVAGQRTRWLLDPDCRARIFDDDLARVTYHYIDKCRAECAMLFPKGAQLEIEVFVSSPRSTPLDETDVVRGGGILMDLSPGEERRMLERVKAHTEAKRREEGKPESQDLVLWRSALDEPPCKVCKWEFEKGLFDTVPDEEEAE